MTTLEDLWYGNILPIENFIEGNAEYKGVLRLVSKNREVLESELSPRQLDILEKYNLSANEMNAASEDVAFQYGLSLGIRLMMESVTSKLISNNM